ASGVEQLAWWMTSNEPRTNQKTRYGELSVALLVKNGIFSESRFLLARLTLQ
ncbi:hypothetical protein EWB00_006803, partial [Schistosoma japonicum]